MAEESKQILDLVDDGFQHFLKALSEADQHFINQRSQQRWCDAGKLLIQQDTESDAVFIIEEGVVEVSIETPDSKVSPPLTYLGRGDIIGELGVMNGDVRTANVKASSDVYYRVLEADVFRDLMEIIPGFAAFIAGRLAKRLSLTTTNIAYNSICMDLSGKLPNFDLISVFYTVAGSASTGELKVVDAAKERVGSFFFKTGKLLHARYLHLQGLEACRQLFTEFWLEGAFSFRRGEVPSHPVEPGYELDLPVEDLVFEGAVLRDGFSLLPEELQRLSGMMQVSNFDGTLGMPETLSIRERIAAMCSNQQLPLKEVWTRSGVSQVDFGKACVELQKHQQMEYFPG
jgi:CRP-like cAMP-binding protein